MDDDNTRKRNNGRYFQLVLWGLGVVSASALTISAWTLSTLVVLQNEVTAIRTVQEQRTSLVPIVTQNQQDLRVLKERDVQNERLWRQLETDLKEIKRALQDMQRRRP